MNKDLRNYCFSFVSVSVVYGCPSLKDDKQKNSSERFITYKPHECTWDSKLILPKAPWPIKSASFTVSLTLPLQLFRDVFKTIIDYFNAGVFHLLLVYIVKDTSFKAERSLFFLKI